MCVFAAAGYWWLTDVALSRRDAPWIRPVFAGLIALLYVSSTFAVPHRLSLGYAKLAADVMSNPKFEHSVMLVSSEHFGEGMFIAEIALREPRPSHYILRATKVLSRSRWNLDNYELLRKTPEEVMKLSGVDSSPTADRRRHPGAESCSAS